jgi:hypothetical protein
MKAEEETNQYELCNMKRPFYIFPIRHSQTPVSLLEKLINIKTFRDCRIECYGIEWGI